MRYIKTYELFYYDGGPRYGSAKDPSRPKPNDLADNHYVYSDYKGKYYTDYDMEDVENEYFKKLFKRFKIIDSATLDLALKAIDNANT